MEERWPIEVAVAAMREPFTADDVPEWRRRNALPFTPSERTTSGRKSTYTRCEIFALSILAEFRRQRWPLVDAAHEAGKLAACWHDQSNPAFNLFLYSRWKANNTWRGLAGNISDEKYLLGEILKCLREAKQFALIDIRLIRAQVNRAINNYKRELEGQENAK